MKRNAMNFKDVITRTPWANVETQLLKAYPNANVSRHGQAYEILKSLEAKPNTMRIVLEVFEPEGPDEPGEVDVYGLNGALRRDFETFAPEVADETLELPDQEMPYALDVTPWEDWLGMQIDPSSLQRFDPAELVAHCLWEMTFHGFEPSDIRAFFEGLQARAQAIQDMTPDERRQHSLSVEEAIALIAEATVVADDNLENDFKHDSNAEA
jgi:hypothetical protein